MSARSIEVQYEVSKSSKMTGLKKTVRPSKSPHTVLRVIDKSYGATASLPPRLITKRELRQIIPYTPQHILRLEKLGRFPSRIRLGENRVAWLLSEVEEWIAARIEERNTFPR